MRTRFLGRVAITLGFVALMSPLLVPLARLGYAFSARAMVQSRWIPVRVAAYHLLGWAPKCSLRLTLAGIRFEQRQEELIQRYLRTNRLVTKEPAMELWDTEQGQFWICPDQERRTTALLFAEQAASLYGDVRAGEIVLDCGSHWGLYTRVALNVGAKLVVGIDPAPETMECFRRTFAAEIARGRVIPYAKGVWNTEGTAQLQVSRHESWQSSFVLTQRREPDRYLPLTTIDRIVSELGLPRVDVIKMDIEGAERQALLGARATIQRFHPRLAVCVYHLPDDIEVIPKLVRELASGYSMRCDFCREYAGFRPHVALFR